MDGYNPDKAPDTREYFEIAVQKLVKIFPIGSREFFRMSASAIKNQVLKNVVRNLAQIEIWQDEKSRDRIEAVINKSAPGATETMKEYLRSLLAVSYKMAVDDWKEDIATMVVAMEERKPDIYFSEDEMKFDLAMRGETEREGYDKESDS